MKGGGARLLGTVLAGAAASLGSLIVGGCAFWGDAQDECVSVEEYQSARAVPDISVPAGLDRPDDSKRLYIPPGPEPVEPLSRQAGCLARPPDFFDKPIGTQGAAN